MRARLHDDSGAVIVFVAVTLGVLLLFVSFVVDIGNAWEHRRHLQTQVDAAALAGAQAMQNCFTGAGDSAVFAAATEYAGATGTYHGTAYGTPLYNGQVGGTNKGSVHVLFQSPTFFNGTNDAGAPTGSPCSPPYALDVKATESALPLFFRMIPGLSSVDAINARARVQLFPLASGGPGLPLAVPNVDPTQAAITFVDSGGDELTSCTGAKLAGTTCTYPLTRGGTSNGIAAWTATTPFQITVPGGKNKTGSYQVALGTAVGRCDKTHTGGSTYTCYGPPTGDSTYPVQQVLLSPADLSGGSHTLTSVSVGILASFTVPTPCSGSSGAGYTCPSDPARLLRWASSSGSANYAFDCGTIEGNGQDLAKQIADGCANTFAINPTGTCPDSANPADCVTTSNVGSGDKLGQIRSALDSRFAPNGVCSVNNYPAVGDTDPRLVVLVVTNTSAWDGQSGAGTIVPVTGFAAFYVTGWDGNVNCSATNEPYPGSGQKHGDIWGHFVKFVDSFGNPNTTKQCDPTSPNPCVPVLTR